MELLLPGRATAIEESPARAATHLFRTWRFMVVIRVLVNMVTIFVTLFGLLITLLISTHEPPSQPGESPSIAESPGRSSSKLWRTSSTRTGQEPQTLNPKPETPNPKP